MEQHSQTWQQEGEALVQAGRYEEALAVYSAARRQAPNDALLHHHQSYVLNELKRCEEALEAAAQVIQLDPEFVPAYCNRAYAALNLKQYDLAYSDYMRVYFRLNDQRAVAALRRTPINCAPIVDEPETVDAPSSQKAMLAYHAQGYVLTQAGWHTEALAAFAQASRFAPAQGSIKQQAMLFYDQGTAMLRLKRYEEALAAFLQACALDPDAAENSYGVGYALSDLGRHAEAVAAFDRAIALDPGMAPAHNDRACSLEHLERYEEALASVEEAIRLAPHLAYPYETRGDILFALQRYEEALASLEQGITHNPNVVFKKSSLLQRTLQALGRAAEEE